MAQSKYVRPNHLSGLALRAYDQNILQALRMLDSHFSAMASETYKKRISTQDLWYYYCSNRPVMYSPLKIHLSFDMRDLNKAILVLTDFSKLPSEVKLLNYWKVARPQPTGERVALYESLLDQVSAVISQLTSAQEKGDLIINSSDILLDFVTLNRIPDVVAIFRKYKLHCRAADLRVEPESVKAFQEILQILIEYKEASQRFLYADQVTIYLDCPDKIFRTIQDIGDNIGAYQSQFVVPAMKELKQIELEFRLNDVRPPVLEKSVNSSNIGVYSSVRCSRDINGKYVPALSIEAKMLKERSADIVDVFRQTFSSLPELGAISTASKRSMMVDPSRDIKEAKRSCVSAESAAAACNFFADAAQVAACISGGAQMAYGDQAEGGAGGPSVALFSSTASMTATAITTTSAAASTTASLDVTAKPDGDVTVAASKHTR